MAAQISASLREVLEQRGVLPRLVASLQAEVLDVVATGKSDSISSASCSPDILLLNELISEYLEATGYVSTASVFRREALDGPSRLSRTFLAAEVGVSVTGEESRVPTLLTLVAAARETARHERGTESGNDARDTTQPHAGDSFSIVGTR